MKSSIKVVFIGLGGRGRNVMSIMLRMPDVEVVGVCDLRPEMLAKGVALVKERRGVEPLATVDYQELLRRDEVDAVMVTTGWNEHLGLCAEAMLAGKYVATEVGGANSLEQCWDIVRASERSKMPCMMLENCCYGRKEMMVLNMVRQGLFGEIIHAEGGYLHDLRKEIALGYERGHFRHAQNQHRNGDVYPTHALGPIAKCLDINRGNRMMTLTSVSSKGRGLNTWLHEHYGADHEKANYPFAIGDVTTTIIKCAHGETIMLTHSTTLPRPYSRRTVIQGTKGIWMEDKKGFYLDGISEK
ncbi:MAG TPA: Gfo/Idh/MocA family oxidoreductase, partial [Lentisphaeria bacterium]|nr:Gfo/Idh/MocA family oxidoreductase [Lentisphaeria bacterium]